MRPPVGLLLICALLLAAYFLSVDSAHASEKRVMGDRVVEEGETVKEISTAWGDVLIKGRVEGDIHSGFGDIEVEGPVDGDVEAGFGNVRINAPVGGDVEAGFGDLDLDEGAQVAGRVYVGHGSRTDHPDAEVHGIQAAGMTFDNDEDSALEVFSDMIGWLVLTSLFIGASVLLAVAVPRPLRASVRSLEASPVRSFVLGIGSVPVVIVLVFLLAITVVGALLLVPAYLALLLFGLLVTAYFLGRKVVLATGRYRAGDALAAAVGAVLVAATLWIPFLGGLIFFALAMLGTGAAILALLTRRRQGGAPRAAYASYEDYLRERDN
jgi:cytoskeletal protein CcmA (bactofilin family)